MSISNEKSVLCQLVFRPPIIGYILGGNAIANRYSDSSVMQNGTYY